MLSGSSKKKSLVSDINVTPFVDVVLVLLVIFMITAPAMFSQTHLQLPKTRKVQKLATSSQQVILTLSSNGDIFLGKEKILLKEVVPNLKMKLKVVKNPVVFLRAHYALEYGQVAKMLALLKSEGIDQVSLVTEIEKR
jgi:biopolymer transport protein TolR